MALDMFAGDSHDCIDHHEEFILDLAQMDEARYPELGAISALFYEGPRLSPRQAGALVHELIDLLAFHGGLANKPLAAVVVRLLPFFSMAYRQDQDIRCSSD